MTHCTFSGFLGIYIRRLSCLFAPNDLQFNFVRLRVFMAVVIQYESLSPRLDLLIATASAAHASLMAYRTGDCYNKVFMHQRKSVSPLAHLAPCTRTS